MAKIKLGAALLATAFVTSALAAAPARKDDPNKVICRDMIETGSRLASKRVCLTREQWRDQRATQRADLEKAQSSKMGPDVH